MAALWHFIAHDSIGPAPPRRVLTTAAENRAVHCLRRQAFRLALICLLALQVLPAAGAGLDSSGSAPYAAPGAGTNRVDSYSVAKRHGAVCCIAHLGCGSAHCSPPGLIASPAGLAMAAGNELSSELERRWSGHVPALESPPPLALPA